MNSSSGRTSAKTAPRLRSPGCIFLVVVIALAALLPPLIYLGLRGAGAFLIVSDRIKKSDAVVVLGGGDQQRVKQAVQLVMDKQGDYLLITEPGEVKPGQGMGSQAVRTEAIEDGLSPYAILITEGISRSTYDELRSVLAFMQQRNFKSVIVVTDPYHTRRARIIFQDTFRGSGLSARIYPVQHSWYRSNTWFLSAEGWGNTVREYVKLAGYMFGLYEE